MTTLRDRELHSTGLGLSIIGKDITTVEPLSNQDISEPD